MKTLIFAATFMCLASLLQAQQADDGWITPTIHGYGRMHEVPHAAYQPDAHHTYKIVFWLTKGPKSPGDVNPSLDKVARAVNLYTHAGTPLSHLRIVAVASDDATALGLNSEQYHTLFGVDNPNLALIALLRQDGVDVAVCGQAVAAHQYEYSWIDASVTTSLSAIITVTTLQQAGYAYVEL